MSHSSPLYIVEDHNDILQHILRGIGSKKLAFQDNLLVHFDAHPDFLINTELKASDVYEKQTLLDKVSIETWILPLAFAGHITSMFWVKPKWAQQIDDGSYSFVIGQDADEHIKVSLPNMYFVSALNYAPQQQLTKTKNINLHVVTLENTEQSKQWCVNELRRVISYHHDFVLDVDLDFFATCNPFLKLYEDCNTYNILRTIYEFKESELVCPEMAIAKRTKQLQGFELCFKSLEAMQHESSQKIIHFIDNNIDKSLFQSSKAHQMFCNLCKDLIKSDREQPIDWLLIHDAGTTIDDSQRELPNHHNSADTNVYLDLFANIVGHLNQPAFFSIARSSLDEYCPPDQVDNIQKAVLETLVNKFNPKIINFYLQQD